MKRKLFQNKIVVQKSNLHGYGVYAEKNIKKDELIEECYIIISKGGDKILEDFYFDANGKYAIFTGFGIIYNHSEEPNADYKLNIKQRYVSIKATEPIRKGEEIFISYGEEWFKSRGLKSRSIKKKKAR